MALVAYITAIAGYLIGQDLYDAEEDEEEAEALKNALELFEEALGSFHITIQKLLKHLEPPSNRTDEDTLRQAIDLLHESEIYLDDARVTALRDLFTLDANAANTYLVLICDDIRKAWIQKRLREFGFPALDAEAR